MPFGTTAELGTQVDNVEKAERYSQLFTASKSGCFSKIVRHLGQEHIKNVYKDICRFEHNESENLNTFLSSVRKNAEDGLMTDQQFNSYKILHQVVTLTALKTKDGTCYKYKTHVLSEFYAKLKQKNYSCSKELQDVRGEIHNDQDMANKRFKRLKEKLFPQNFKSKAAKASSEIDREVNNAPEQKYKLISWEDFSKGEFDEKTSYKLKFDVVNGEDLRAMYNGLNNSKADSNDLGEDGLDDDDDSEDSLDDDDSEDDLREDDSEGEGDSFVEVIRQHVTVPLVASVTPTKLRNSSPTVQSKPRGKDPVTLGNVSKRLRVAPDEADVMRTTKSGRVSKPSYKLLN